MPERSVATSDLCCFWAAARQRSAATTIAYSHTADVLVRSQRRRRQQARMPASPAHTGLRRGCGGRPCLWDDFCRRPAAQNARPAPPAPAPRRPGSAVERCCAVAVRSRRRQQRVAACSPPQVQHHHHQLRSATGLAARCLPSGVAWLCCRCTRCRRRRAHGALPRTAAPDQHERFCPRQLSGACGCGARAAARRWITAWTTAARR